MSVIVQKAGVLTTIQDYGRYGYEAIGITNAGAVDKYSMFTANLLIGNPKEAPVLEATLLGPTLEFLESTQIAITGGDMSPEINGIPVQMNSALVVREGDILALGIAKKGCRSYIAIRGGFLGKEEMGSVSTDLKCKLGGVNGDKLKDQDKLETAPFVFYKKKSKCLREKKQAKEQVIRIVKGPEYNHFTKEGKAVFLNSEYLMTNDMNRMACKLEGPEIESIGTNDIISNSIVTGSIQIASNRKPIIMLVDHQTTGGYAVIGTVILIDIDKLAQCKPGDKVKFKVVSIATAERLYKKRMTMFNGN